MNCFEIFFFNESVKVTLFGHPAKIKNTNDKIINQTNLPCQFPLIAASFLLPHASL